MEKVQGGHVLATSGLGSSTLDAETLSPGSGTNLKRKQERVPTLTLAYHPEAGRIGQQAALRKVGTAWQAEVSRLTPDFVDAGGATVGPLRHRFISRQPVVITVTQETVRLSATQPIKVEGVVAESQLSISLGRLDQGLLIELTGGVLLFLKLQAPPHPARFGLLGMSDAVSLVRDEIGRVGPQEVSVLIQGETGAGKELIARGLHQCSKRAKQPFVAVNMGAIPKDTAVAELFGYKKGAFTGAVTDHPGYFGLAEGGTLFLDEIGETPEAVQPILLRALENGELQPLGGGKAKKTNVRVLAATDANLDSMVSSGQFRNALLYRLGGYMIKAPPLRERKEDIPVLFLEFLRQELARAGKEALLNDESPHPWLRGRLLTQLVAHSWPGNVRELRNVASQVVAFSASLPRSEFPPAFANLAAPVELSNAVAEGQTGAAVPAIDSEKTAPPSKGSDRPKKPAEISDSQLLAALKGNAWSINATARTLGISKNSLYELIDRCPSIRKARDLTKAEILAAQSRHAADQEAMAGELQVSLRALKLRMKELGIH